MEFSGKCTAHNPIGSEPKEGEVLRPALQTVKFLDVQWSDCPVEIEEMVSAVWREFGLGNDNYIFRTTVNQIRELAEDQKWYTRNFNNETMRWEQEEFDLNIFADYLSNQGLEDDEDVIIHWWW